MLLNRFKCSSIDNNAPRLQKNILNEKSSIKEALNLLDILKIKIIFVINTSRVFCGTITDGDIRRGLLRGVT